MHGESLNTVKQLRNTPLCALPIVEGTQHLYQGGPFLRVTLRIIQVIDDAPEKLLITIADPHGPGGHHFFIMSVVVITAAGLFVR